MENNGTVKKDMSDDYNERLSMLLDSLHEAKLKATTNMVYMIYVNFALHQIYLWIHRKMTDDEIKTQDKFQYHIKTQIPFRIVQRQDSSGDIIPYYSQTKQFYLYEKMLEDRELALYKVLERVGLTAKSKPRKLT